MEEGFEETVWLGMRQQWSEEEGEEEEQVEESVHVCYLVLVWLWNGTHQLK